MRKEEDDDLFSVVRAADIPEEREPERWLVESLWGESAVGVIGGLPKSLKSWLALEIAVSVAAGSACLGCFAVERRGPALVYLAEDSLPAVRERLEALATAHRVELRTLDVHVITEKSMRLDLARDQMRLQKTVRALTPRLLVLDPLVRLHRLDENSSAEVSGFLAYLRELQREFAVSVLVVHHSRKSAPPSSVAGQGLRGSGDFHAWSDSALYLRRRSGAIEVTVEHRAAPAPEPFALELVSEDGRAPRLELRDGAKAGRPTEVPLADRVVAALCEARTPQTRAALRDVLSVRNERLGGVLEELERGGRIERAADGWRLSERGDGSAFPFPSIGMSGNGTIAGEESGTQEGLR